MAAPRVVFYATRWCPYCTRARQVLAAKGVEIEEIDVEARPGAREEMFARSGGTRCRRSSSIRPMSAAAMIWSRSMTPVDSIHYYRRRIND